MIRQLTILLVLVAASATGVQSAQSAPPPLLPGGSSAESIPAKIEKALKKPQARGSSSEKRPKARVRGPVMKKGGKVRRLGLIDETSDVMGPCLDPYWASYGTWETACRFDRYYQQVHTHDHLRFYYWDQGSQCWRFFQYWARIHDNYVTRPWAVYWTPQRDCF
jgi:hypothetical protein